MAQAGYGCTGGGYLGHDSWGYEASASTNQFGPHNCTAYVAFRLENDGVDNPEPLGDGSPLGDAKFWASRASAKGIQVDQTPTRGSIAQWNSGKSGHVGYVDAVNADGSIIVSSDNLMPQDSLSWPGGYTATVKIPKGAAVWPANFIHFKSKYGAPQVMKAQFHDDGTLVSFTGPAVPAGTTVRWYAYEAYNASTNQLYNQGVLNGLTSPALTNNACGVNITCKYRIRAVVDGGQTPWSNFVAITGLPAPVLNLILTTDSQTTLIFTPPAVPAGTTIRWYAYEAYNASTNQLYNQGILNGITSPAIIDNTCGANLTCSYQIRAVVDGGQSPWSKSLVG